MGGAGLVLPRTLAQAPSAAPSSDVARPRGSRLGTSQPQAGLALWGGTHKSPEWRCWTPGSVWGQQTPAWPSVGTADPWPGLAQGPPSFSLPQTMECSSSPWPGPAPIAGPSVVTPVPVGLSLSPSCVLAGQLPPQGDLRLSGAVTALWLPFRGAVGVADPQTKGPCPVPGRVGTAGMCRLPSPPAAIRGVPSSAGLWGGPKGPPSGPSPAPPGSGPGGFGEVSGSPGLLRGVRAAGAALAALGGGRGGSG